MYVEIIAVIPLAVRVLGTLSVGMFTLRIVIPLDALLLKNFFINKFIYCTCLFFYIMYLDTIHSPSLHVHPLPLQLPNKTKLKRKK